jgi:hypothetical protein
MNALHLRGAGATVVAALTVGACAPTVRLQAPEEPIRFDVNVNITEQKRLEIDQELLALIRQNPALFGFEAGELSQTPAGSEPQ